MSIKIWGHSTGIYGASVVFIICLPVYPLTIPHVIPMTMKVIKVFSEIRVGIGDTGVFTVGAETDIYTIVTVKLLIIEFTTFLQLAGGFD